MKIDKLNNDTIYYTKPFLVSGKVGLMPKPFLQFTLFTSGKNIAISILGQDYSRLSSLQQGDSISFKFKSGGFYSIIYPETTFSEYIYQNSMYAFNQLLLIDQDDIDNLIKEEIVFVRVGTSEKGVDFDLSEKNQKNLQNALILFKEMN